MPATFSTPMTTISVMKMGWESGTLAAHVYAEISIGTQLFCFEDDFFDCVSSRTRAVVRLFID